MTHRRVYELNEQRKKQKLQQNLKRSIRMNPLAKLGSLNNESLKKEFYHLSRKAMKQDVQHYIRYYNRTRLHSTNGDLYPIDFELSLSNVSDGA